MTLRKDQLALWLHVDKCTRFARKIKCKRWKYLGRNFFAIFDIFAPVGRSVGLETHHIKAW